MAAAVALANLALLDEGGIVERVRHDTGPYLQRALRDAFAGHPLVGEIQGAGAVAVAVAALQLAESKAEKKRFDYEALVGLLFCMFTGFDLGLIVRAVQERIVIAPALVATHAEIDELVDKQKIALDRTAIEVGMR